MKNDRLIQHNVLSELDRETRIAVGTIGVEVHHGTVRLAGRVADETIKKSAELAARRVDGVTTVVMDIDVAAAGAAPRTPRSVTRAA